MKFIHLSDLHLGKRVNEFSMIEDQEYILKKIINIIDDAKAEAVLIAGDVYDKPVPTEEAIRLWDDFLCSLVKRNLKVFVISGNHDSQVRLSEHNRLVEATGVYLSPVYNGKISPITVTDEYGDINIYMLPFVKPATVKPFFEEENAPQSYTDALRLAIKAMEVDPAKRNILIAHQFVTGASPGGSEEVNVGGLDNVDAAVFEDFDYVALGHIHGKQNIGNGSIRYCGTPLKYSFSEKDHKKTVTVLEMGEKGDKKISEFPLVPLHDLRQIRGTYMELTDKRNYEGTDVEDYIHAVLTDEEDVYDAAAKLRIIYPNLMKLSYDNERTRTNQEIGDIEDIGQKSPLELFEEFYRLQNNQEMSDSQKGLCRELIDSIRGGTK